MKWDELLRIAKDNPIITTGFLATIENPVYLRVQLSRWVEQGKLIKLKRGYYVINKPYTDKFPSQFLIGNTINFPSYVSLESALSHYSLIPEYVPTIMSVTTARPQIIKNQLGVFIYRHIKKPLFFGYKKIDIEGEKVFVAEREKALIDLFYLNDTSENYIKELRLQNLETIDMEKLKDYAISTGKRKIAKAVSMIEEIYK